MSAGTRVSDRLSVALPFIGNMASNGSPGPRGLASLRVAVFGARGRMGAFHSATLKEIGVEDVVEIDLGDEYPDRFDAAVVASPAIVHEEHLRVIRDRGVPVYCEKPLTNDLEVR